MFLEDLHHGFLNRLRPAVVAIRIWMHTIGRSDMVGTCLIWHIHKIHALILLDNLLHSLLDKLYAALLLLIVRRLEIAILAIDSIEEDDRHIRVMLAYSLDKWADTRAYLSDSRIREGIAKERIGLAFAKHLAKIWLQLAIARHTERTQMQTC